jgi:hypothetical protein
MPLRVGKGREIQRPRNGHTLEWFGVQKFARLTDHEDGRTRSLWLSGAELAFEEIRQPFGVGLRL